ncbi:MAG: acetyl-CoA carboxylase biotin carboxyl carrier protein subunit [Candidatus Aegiribacteria sp.]|nr:acetyl-CoA carboxylase biotin carboxyl carrier protein subunit [Candidatus Aegiribacteria sp.]MBD3294899.1 acetyl-CoA carboxylase biotin carboxyl carrier protein subunit [Candidatus Fermentibacteria bacterium]
MPEYKITVNGKTYSVNIGRITDDTVDVTLDGRTYEVEVEAPVRKASKTPVIRRERQVVNAADVPNRTSPPGTPPPGSGAVLAPLPGLILKVLVGKGDSVSEGQPIAVMEAMKMENEIEAPISGTVQEVAVSEGENVLENALIMKTGG